MHFSSVSLADTSPSLVQESWAKGTSTLPRSSRPSGKCSLCRKVEQEGHPAAAPSVCTAEQTWRQTPTPSEPVRDPACTRKHLWATYQTYRNRAKKVFQWLKRYFNLCWAFFMQPTDFLTVFPKSHPWFSLFLHYFVSECHMWIGIGLLTSMKLQCSVPTQDLIPVLCPFRHVFFTSTLFYSNIFFNLNSICPTYFYLHSK